MTLSHGGIPSGGQNSTHTAVSICEVQNWPTGHGKSGSPSQTSRQTPGTPSILGRSVTHTHEPPSSLVIGQSSSEKQSFGVLTWIGHTNSCSGSTKRRYSETVVATDIRNSTSAAASVKRWLAGAVISCERVCGWWAVDDTSERADRMCGQVASE